MIKFSAAKSIELLIIGFTFYLIMACQPKEKITPNPEFLFGKWIEKESEEVIQFGGTNHIFEFTEEAFFLERDYWTDALDPNNECLNGHTAYFMGTYELEGSNLLIDGQSTNIDFEVSPPACNRAVVYRDTFEFKQEGAQTLILNPEEQIYNQIRLEKE